MPFLIRTFVIYKATAVVCNVDIVQIVKVAGTQLRLHPYGWVVKKLFDDSQRFFQDRAYFLTCNIVAFSDQ